MQRRIGTLYGEARVGKHDRRDFTVPVTKEDLKMTSDELRSLLGDEKAQVSYSMGYADKDFGNGFDVRVGVTLTCGQSADEVQAALTVASELVGEALEGTVQQAKELDRAIRTS